VAINVVSFGDAPGIYYAKTGYHSAAASDSTVTASSYWLTFFYPPVAMKVT